MGDWKQQGNPCKGPALIRPLVHKAHLYCRLPVSRDTYVFMADRWNKTDLQASRYVWLPLQVTNGNLQIKWAPQFVSPLRSINKTGGKTFSKSHMCCIKRMINGSF
jgi:hypothetical protein